MAFTEQQHYDSVYNSIFARAMARTLQSNQCVLESVEKQFAHLRKRDLKPGAVVTEPKRKQWRSSVAKIDALNAAMITQILNPSPPTSFHCDECHLIHHVSKFAYIDDDDGVDYEVCKACEAKLKKHRELEKKWDLEQEEEEAED
jgi:hypothetical protein